MTEEKMREVSRAREISVLFEPAEDVPGSWVAHVLELDLVTYGASLDDAFEMVVDAVRLVARSDAESGLDPFDRVRAPLGHWIDLAEVLDDPRRRVLAELDSSDRCRVVAAAARMSVVVAPFVRVEIVPGALGLPWGGWNT